MEINLKEGEVVPVTSDRMFKAILMDSKEYLADILSNILDIDKNYILDNLVFKNTEQGILGVSEKRKVTDLIVDINKLTINLEMNASYSRASVRKNNAYLSRIMAGAIESGKDYDNLDIVVVQINFDKVWKFEDELITIFEMRNKSTYRKRSSYIESNDPVIYHVNLSKAYKMYYNKDRKLNTFIKELALMIANNKEDLNNIAKGDKVMEGAINKITSLSMDDYIKGYYIKEEQDEWMRNIDIADARKTGRKEGLKEGERLGLEKGINQTKIETAKKMKEENIPLDTIVKITGLTKEEIEKL